MKAILNSYPSDLLYLLSNIFFKLYREAEEKGDLNSTELQSIQREIANLGDRTADLGLNKVEIDLSTLRDV